MNEQTETAPLGFNELLLGAVIVLMAAGLGMIVALYVLPLDRPEAPTVQPSVRVARVSDFPVGASRLISWGERTILVVRRDEQRFAALQGVSPRDGCILRWDEQSLRVVSPCSYEVFDLSGNVVTGLTTTPLLRYPVFTRSGIVYVGRES